MEFQICAISLAGPLAGQWGRVFPCVRPDNPSNETLAALIMAEYCRVKNINPTASVWNSVKGSSQKGKAGKLVGELVVHVGVHVYHIVLILGMGGKVYDIGLKLSH